MNPGLPVISGREAVRAFERAGFAVVKRRGKGSHFFVTRQSPRVNLTIPNHKELKSGLLRGLIRTAGMTVDQFNELL